MILCTLIEVMEYLFKISLRLYPQFKNVHTFFTYMRKVKSEKCAYETVYIIKAYISISSFLKLLEI